jgi:hypothetical protein
MTTDANRPRRGTTDRPRYWQMGTARLPTPMARLAARSALR